MTTLKQLGFGEHQVRVTQHAKQRFFDRFESHFRDASSIVSVIKEMAIYGRIFSSVDNQGSLVLRVTFGDKGLVIATRQKQLIVVTMVNCWAWKNPKPLNASAKKRKLRCDKARIKQFIKLAKGNEDEINK